MITYEMVVVLGYFSHMDKFNGHRTSILHFCQDRTKHCAQLFSLESGLVREYAIVSISSHSTFITSLLDRITLSKSSTKVTNVESAFTVTSIYEKY